MNPTLYAESSAILAWLLGEAEGPAVAAELRGAAQVVASNLTIIECERVLIRAWSLGLMTEAAAADQRFALARAAAHWVVLHLDAEVTERCRRPFPIEPVRTPDALHLGSVSAARAVIPDLAVLTLDQRIRENAVRLGLEVFPRGASAA